MDYLPNRTSIHSAATGAAYSKGSRTGQLRAMRSGCEIVSARYFRIML